MSEDPASSLVFISYARPDYDKASRLYTDLKTRGLNPWLDKESILPGQDWDNEIKRAIKKSRFFIALLSSNSVTKIGYVQRELKNALEKQEEFPEPNTYLIPARLDECNIEDLRLTKIQYVDLFSEWNMGIEKIVKAMEVGNSSQGASNLNNIKYRLESSLIGIETKLSPLKYYTQLEKLMEWYSKKANHEKSRFNVYQITIIIAGISIPVINAIILATELARVIVSIIAMIIFFSVAISQVHKYEEKWILTSTVNEGLSNEKDFFDNNAGSYSGLNDDEKHKLLVERAKFIIQDELSGNLPID